MLTRKQIMLGCPNLIEVRDQLHCKALVGQPNGSLCDPKNCAALHIADLLINELREEIYSVLGGKDENAKGTAASSGGNES